MNRIVNFLFFIFVPFVFTACRTENPHEVERDKSGKYILEKEDGSFVIAGTKKLYDYNQVYFLTIDAAGNFQSSYNFGMVGVEHPVAIHENYTGDYAVLTVTENKKPEHVEYRYVVCREDGEPYDVHHLSEEYSNGNVRFDATGFVRNYNNTYTIAGNYYTGSAPKAFVVRIHEDGTLYHYNYYDFACEAHDVATNNSGENIIVGKMNETQVTAFKINPAGDSLWTRAYNMGEKAVGTDIVNNGSQGYYIAGEVGNYQGKSFLLSISMQGDSLWSKTFSGHLASHKGFGSLPNNELIFALNESNGYSILKTDGSGNPLWKRTYAPEKNVVRIHCIQSTSDNGCIVTGDILNEQGVSYIYISKFDQWGNQLWKTGL